VPGTPLLHRHRDLQSSPAGIQRHCAARSKGEEGREEIGLNEAKTVANHAEHI
jgi:hypothetical protein